jgi:hypothetical protein
MAQRSTIISQVGYKICRSYMLSLGYLYQALKQLLVPSVNVNVPFYLIHPSVNEVLTLSEEFVISLLVLVSSLDCHIHLLDYLIVLLTHSLDVIELLQMNFHASICVIYLRCAYLFL